MLYLWLLLSSNYGIGYSLQYMVLPASCRPTLLLMFGLLTLTFNISELRGLFRLMETVGVGGLRCHQIISSVKQTNSNVLTRADAFHRKIAATNMRIARITPTNCIAVSS